MAEQQKRHDEEFDRLLVRALEDAAEIRANKMFGAYEECPEPELSEEFHRKMSKIIGKATGKNSV